MDARPIWLMRQAGRYLPQYREIRRSHPFLELCTTPELAAQVTVLPVDQLDVDAAIVFSDILVLPRAMGLAVEYEPQGPVISPAIRSAQDVDRIRPVDPVSDLAFVMDTIRQTRDSVASSVPVIGFAGAPLTLAAYMVEGTSSPTFTRLRTFLHAQPEAAHRLFKKLAAAVAFHLSAQLEAGASAVQIFDTWSGILDADDFASFVLPYLQEITSFPGLTRAPIIYFSRGNGSRLEMLAQSGATVLSVDWTVDLSRVRAAVGDSMAIQGNLDPAALLGPRDVLKTKVDAVLKRAGSGMGHIFSLGHGILPETDPDAARALVAMVREAGASTP